MDPKEVSNVLSVSLGLLKTCIQERFDCLTKIMIKRSWKTWRNLKGWKRKFGAKHTCHIFFLVTVPSKISFYVWCEEKCTKKINSLLRKLSGCQLAYKKIFLCEGFCEWQLFLLPVTDKMEVTAHRIVMTIWGTKGEMWQNVQVI